jgi:hypothetical protein
MGPEVLEMFAAVMMTVLIGAIILLFPLSRRLGRVLEEWIKLRHESSPDRDRLERLELGVLEIRQLVEGIDQRMALMGERQDFMESLIESKKAESLPAEAGPTRS